MKKISILFAAALVLAACKTEPQVTVEVSNPLAVERILETVEVAWDSVAAGVEGITPESVVVLDGEGVQIPSQHIAACESGATPALLIFQATVKADGHSAYTIKKGVREEYPAQAFGRYVPERKDDYAWENNLVAFRLYGPALESELVTPGFDLWSKRTPELVIDNWFAINDYHNDHGEGKDCYKVGPTLGAGSAAPFVDGQLCLSRNYATQRNLANGPIRTTVLLTYAPFAAGADTVSVVKAISLDANTRFSKIVNVYDGKFATMDIAPGIVVHPDARPTLATEAVMLTEPASDSKDPAADGDISVAVILPGAARTLEAQGHILAVAPVAPGQPLVYWMGAGWSKAGVADDAQWVSTVEQQVELLKNPLRVTIK